MTSDQCCCQRLSDLEVGACLRKARPDAKVIAKRYRGNHGFDAAELQKDFQFGSRHLFIIIKSFYLLRQPPRHCVQLRDIPKLSKSHGMPWQRWVCNAKADGDKRRGPVNTPLPNTRYASLPVSHSIHRGDEIPAQNITDLFGIKQCRDHAWRPSDLSPITLFVQDCCM